MSSYPSLAEIHPPLTNIAAEFKAAVAFAASRPEILCREDFADPT